MCCLILRRRFLRVIPISPSPKPMPISSATFHNSTSQLLRVLFRELIFGLVGPFRHFETCVSLQRLRTVTSKSPSKVTNERTYYQSTGSGASQVSSSLVDHSLATRKSCRARHQRSEELKACSEAAVSSVFYGNGKRVANCSERRSNQRSWFYADRTVPQNMALSSRAHDELREV